MDRMRVTRACDVDSAGSPGVLLQTVVTVEAAG